MHDVLLMTQFMRPHRLWFLLLVPAIALLYLLLNGRFRPSPARRHSRLDLVIPKDAAWKRHGAVALALASLAALVVAWAMPKAYTNVPRDRATIIITIDVSRSMVATDVEPNRLAAAQSAAQAFTRQLPERFNVALVTFAATTQMVVPPTTDRGAVDRAIQNLEVAPSTAIGDGIYASLDALKLVPPDPQHPKEVAPAAIVLLSDGATNIGRSSLTAAEQSKKQNVPVYTIAYGTATGYVMEGGQRQPVPVNHAELAAVARASGGKKFSAASKDELEAVYKTIAQSVGYEKVYTEVTDRYAGLALLFAVLSALGVISLGARWP
ncbi:VWA domain-containing protein [Luteococcus sp. H101]|uniref:VWA domain-containing protein n=1 Tax=unclassified Luteococcus TaxID=2639923 RepID=UPI00406D1DE4